jgi:hypothetical protein
MFNVEDMKAHHDAKDAEYVSREKARVNARIRQEGYAAADTEAMDERIEKARAANRRAYYARQEQAAALAVDEVEIKY